MFLISDFILAMMPVFLITSVLVHRPLREKVILCVLMSLGLVCTAATVPKLISLNRYGIEESDVSWVLADVFVWTTIEMWLAIIVACMPPMRNAFERLLMRLGMVVSDSVNVGFIHGDWRGNATGDMATTTVSTIAGRTANDLLEKEST